MPNDRKLIIILHYVEHFFLSIVTFNVLNDSLNAHIHIFGMISYLLNQMMNFTIISNVYHKMFIRVQELENDMS